MTIWIKLHGSILKASFLTPSVVKNKLGAGSKLKCDSTDLWKIYVIYFIIILR